MESYKVIYLFIIILGCCWGLGGASKQDNMNTFWRSVVTAVKRRRNSAAGVNSRCRISFGLRSAFEFAALSFRLCFWCYFYISISQRNIWIRVPGMNWIRIGIRIWIRIRLAPQIQPAFACIHPQFHICYLMPERKNSDRSSMDFLDLIEGTILPLS